MKEKAVVTVAVGKALDWLAVSEPTMREYATRVDAEFVKLTDVTCPYPMGEKWQVEKLFDVYERILYIDADVVVRPTAPNLFELVPENSVGVYDDMPDMAGRYAWYYAEIEQLQRELGLRPSPLHHCYNAGLVMASRMHREIWRQPHFFRPTHCYEQNLVNCKIRDNGFKVYNFDRRTHWQWWTDKENKYKADGCFLHFSGMKDHQERLRLMREVAVGISKPAVQKKDCKCTKTKALRDQLRAMR
jgi:lipopolysaccharide biosynthesis glycosyltransferase